MGQVNTVESAAKSATSLSKWDHRFLELAKHVSAWSKDPSTQVGAVLVDENNLVTGLGFNGFPRGVEDSDDRLNDRPTKYAMVVHAEVNAILMAGSRAKGCRLYVYPSFSIPCICNECCKVAIQMGVREVIGYTPTAEDAERALRWQESINIAKVMLTEAGVGFREVARAETNFSNSD